MALRSNVRNKRREIRRELSPLQNYLLDDIIEGTVNDWDSVNEFNLKDLAAGLGIRVNRIYVMLKDLHARGIIVREPTRYPGLEKLGLNPEYFGQVLINHQNDLEKKRRFKLVVVNHPSPASDSRPQSPIRKNSQPVQNETHSNPKIKPPSPEKDRILTQKPEITQENSSLDSLRFIKKFLEEKNGASSTPSGDRKPIPLPPQEMLPQRILMAADPSDWDPNGPAKARMIREMVQGIRSMP